MTDRLVIQCNYAEGTKIAPEGARAYLALTNPGNANDRIQAMEEMAADLNAASARESSDRMEKP